MKIQELDRLSAVLAASRSGTLAPEALAAVRDIAEWHGILTLLAFGAARSQPGSEAARGWLAACQRDAMAADASRQPGERCAIEALAARGVRSLVLKGAHLAHAVYPSPHLRPRHDLDILVSEEEKDFAAAALVAAGHRIVPHVRGDLILAQMHFERVSESGIRHAIDLHWRAINPQPFRTLLPFEEALARAQPIPGLGPAARGLSFDDALVLACAHLVAHHAAGVRLIWLYDVDQIARRLDAHLWHRFAERALEGRVGTIARQVLRRSAALFGTQVPADVEQALSSGQAGERLTSAYLEPRSRAGLLLLDLRALDSWANRFRYVKQHAWPDREYMRERYGTGGAGMLWAYLRRAVSGASAWLTRPE
jgi:hypothetical protein